MRKPRLVALVVTLIGVGLVFLPTASPSPGSPLPTFDGHDQSVTTTATSPSSADLANSATASIVLECDAHNQISARSNTIASAYNIVNSCTENGVPVPYTATSTINLYVFDRNDKVYDRVATDTSDQTNGLAIVQHSCSTPSTWIDSGEWSAILPDGAISNVFFQDGPVGC